MFYGSARFFKACNGFDVLRYAHILFGIVVQEHQQYAKIVLFDVDAGIRQLNEKS